MIWNKNKEGMNEIPLNIFTVWIGSEIPESMQQLFDKIKHDNPEFDFQCFDDKKSIQFLKSHFDESILDAYNHLIPGSYKSDLMRFALLYINGGIYIDAKMEPVNNFKFNKLLDKEYYLNDEYINFISTYTNTKEDVSTQIIVSKPKNEILMCCIHQIIDNIKNKFYGKHTNEVTGPGVLHKCLFENKITTRELKIEYFDTKDFYYITKYPYGRENAILKQNITIWKEQQKYGLKGKTHVELWNDKNIFL
jgi:mannosyltransferase OCH1-like enzyme